VRAVSLHHDVIVVTSQLLQVNCTIVRAPGGQESFVIDSPVLPEELALLPSILEQAAFPAPSGLLVTHADWDHLLAPLAFAGASIGCAESSATRLRAEPGAAQRALRDFDEDLYLVRRPLSLAAVQALAVPGRCEIGSAELELHPTEGHTADGMALWIGWAGVLVAGDYLSAVELPALNDGDRIDAYLATLQRLRALVADAEQVVPGHGPVLDGARAARVLDEDVVYLRELRERGERAVLPQGRRSKAQRQLHVENVRQLSGQSAPRG
jgi:glyoxylase-like metal-dependent hydrolase (beta-lactamase superfamily II)